MRMNRLLCSVQTYKNIGIFLDIGLLLIHELAFIANYVKCFVIIRCKHFNRFINLLIKMSSQFALQ